MKMSLNFILSDDVLTVIGETGNTYPVSTNHKNYNKIRSLLFDNTATEQHIIVPIDSNFNEILCEPEARARKCFAGAARLPHGGSLHCRLTLDL